MGSVIKAVNEGQTLTKEQERELYIHRNRLYNEANTICANDFSNYPYVYHYIHNKKNNVSFDIKTLFEDLPTNAVKVVISDNNYKSGYIEPAGVLLDFEIKYINGFNPQAEKDIIYYIKGQIYVKELWPHDFEDSHLKNPYIDTFEGAYEFELMKFDYFLDALTGPFCNLVLMPYLNRQIQKINKFIKDNKMKANQLSTIIKHFLGYFTVFIKEYPYEPERLRRILTSA